MDTSAPASAFSTGRDPRGTARRTTTRRAPRRPVNARTRLTRESLVKRGKLTSRPAAAASAERLLEMQRAASRDRAALLAQASAFWVDRDDDGLADDRAESDLAVAIALRTTTSRATRLLQDAHLAVDGLPATFARLSQGDIPTEWFDRIIRNARDLTIDQRSEFDEIISEWDLSSIPAERFYDELRLLRSWYDADGARTRPEETRDVALECSPVDDGTACLRITGPIPEIHALAQRLDAAARAIQAQQRHALEDGTPIPFDLDGDVARELSAMTLAELRYAVITRSVLDTGGVHVPAPAHRINVVVPVLTLMGLSDAPATYDGVVPLPADMARKLAAQESVWFRVLTDPTRGEFLPLPADQYRPTVAMVEHLRLRDPVCAVPTCTRRTSSDAENDHIEEFDHAHPARGGPTSIRNLHRLHWGHHDDKTRRLIDPERNDDGSTSWTIGTPVRARITTAPRRDLLTPFISTALADSWDRYQWFLELDALDRSGFIDQFLREGGPEDPALDDAPPPPEDLGDPPF
ncbi:HNH endonuclease [Brachybacterium alimentarium]|nr:HNH endonuclease [Brachybacterium alimentarium]RCS69110.1 HNH endonuclease [Brachybacterium alimentarium]RCS83129.1 HNH endonuclease [Brachybacterium alimentarium]RCS90310.1 HNH endonuclease [Brachybacterium alimentarium]